MGEMARKRIDWSCLPPSRSLRLPLLGYIIMVLGVLPLEFELSILTCISPPTLDFLLSVEEATGLDQQSPQAGDEVRQGHFGIQAFGQVAAQGKVQVDFDCLQLPPPSKVGS